MSSTDPFLKLAQLTDELWNEKKGLSHGSSPKSTIKRVAKLVKEIRALKLEQELEMLCELYQVDKSILL